MVTALLKLTLTLAHAGGPVQLVTGEDFTCQRDNAGEVSCWGNNEDHQLGLSDGTATASTPTRNGVSGAIDLSAGGLQSCAINGSGAVTCWGQSETPAWGTGVEPKRALGIQDAAEIALRASGGCLRHRGGRVSCWDNNRAIGNRTFPIPQVSMAEQVVVGRAHGCARVQGGSVWCWGDDRRGQLGQSRAGWPSTAVQVPGLHQIVDIAAGGDVTCAANRSGTVFCWGGNRDGNLGVGHTNPVFGPQRVHQLEQAMEVSVGSHETCARTRSGDIYCWGADPCPRPDAPTRRMVPTALPIHDATAISTGGQSDHKCALTGAGTTCWGFNSHGQANAKERCATLEEQP